MLHVSINVTKNKPSCKACYPQCSTNGSLTGLQQPSSFLQPARVCRPLLPPAPHTVPGVRGEGWGSERVKEVSRDDETIPYMVLQFANTGWNLLYNTVMLQIPSRIACSIRDGRSLSTVRPRPRYIPCIRIPAICKIKTQEHARKSIHSWSHVHSMYRTCKTGYAS